MPDDSALLSVLTSLRDRGAVGEADLPRAIDHADRFVAALPAGCKRLIDLGSGGGLPGLVIASRCPELAVVLTDRRERHADLLRLACTRLGLAERVSVLTIDVVALGRDAEFTRRFDAVTARSFGEPLWTMECARPFLRDEGVLIVSEPPISRNGESAERWPQDAVAELGFRWLELAVPGVRCFTRSDVFHVEQEPDTPRRGDSSHVSRET